MTEWPEDQKSDSLTQKTNSTTPNYWVGLLLTILFPGAGFAYINRLWPTIVMVVLGNIFLGPIASHLFGMQFSKASFNIWMLIYILHLFWYRNAYQDQYKFNKISVPQLSMPMRFIGVWLGLIFLLIQYALRSTP